MRIFLCFDINLIIKQLAFFSIFVKLLYFSQTNLALTTSNYSRKSCVQLSLVSAVHLFLREIISNRISNHFEWPFLVYFS